MEKLNQTIMAQEKTGMERGKMISYIGQKVVEIEEEENGSCWFGVWVSATTGIRMYPVWTYHPDSNIWYVG